MLTKKFVVYRLMAACLVLALMILGFCNGCFHALAPRTADVLDAREFSVGINLTLIGVTGKEEDGSSRLALEPRALTHFSSRRRCQPCV